MLACVWEYMQYLYVHSVAINISEFAFPYNVFFNYCKLVILYLHAVVNLLMYPPTQKFVI